MTDRAGFVGRGDELDRARAALAVAHAGRTQLLLFSGESGVGKSRLADEIAVLAEQSGAHVLWAAAMEGAPPYWLWRQALPTFDRELGGKAPSPFELVPLVAGVFTQGGDRRPTVLVLDDIHAADEASLQLIDLLVRSKRDLPLLIVATCSDAAHQTSTSDALTRMLSYGERIDLRGLQPDEVGPFYEATTGMKCSTALAHELFTASEGHPLFLKEAIRSLDVQGLQRPDESMGFRVPGGARALLRRRLSGLDNDVLRVLAIASVLGRRFNVTLLRELTTESTSRLLDHLSEATTADIVQEVGGHGEYAFTQVLLREVLYEDLRASERMTIHASVAEGLMQRFHTDEDEHIADIAHHLFKAAQAADQKITLRYLVRAGKVAAARGMPAEAARHLRRAVKVADLLGVSRARRTEITQALDALEEIPDPGDSREHGPSAPAPSNTFRREGDYWTVGYQSEVIRVKDSKGMRYLDILLRVPGREIHALELAATVGGGSQRISISDHSAEGLSVTSFAAGDPLVDARAKAAFKERIADLEEEIDDAEEMNDTERGARARAELDALAEHLATTVGLGGRDRKASFEAEKARLSVSKAIRSALAKISDSSPALGEHLDTTVRTGYFCSYRPDPRAPIQWTT